MNREDIGTRLVGLLAAAVLVVSASGCAWTVRAGELQTESRTVELDGAEFADVSLRMGAGGLTLTGGAKELAKANFTYNVADWRPTIDYSVNSGGQGDLSIEQPAVRNLGLDSYRYEWDVRLNEEVPMALDVALGAGESELDVGSLNLSDLDLKIGFGGVELDLRGDREEDLDVTIRGGVGEVTVLLPSEVGVEASVSGGPGELDTSGMRRDGDVYINAAYEESGATITLDIEGGVGGVHLKVAD
jgi:hypothetical protein